MAKIILIIETEESVEAVEEALAVLKPVLRMMLVEPAEIHTDIISQ